MKAVRAGGELSVLHLLAGALFAGLAMALTRRFVLVPLLGMDSGKTAADVLMWFLLGYLAMAVSPLGHSPPPLLSGLRLRSGLIFGGIGSLAMLLVNWLWP